MRIECLCIIGAVIAVSFGALVPARSGGHAIVAALEAGLAGKILGDVEPTASAASVTDQLKAYFDKLSERDIAELKCDLQEAEARLSIATAKTPSASEQEKFSKVLRPFSGDTAAPAFTADPELLGSAGLRFPHAVVDISWAGRPQ